MNKEQLATRFTNFAHHECEGSSPLYKMLSLKIAKDDDLLELCTHARSGQPVPNLLFGAVHYLLLTGHNDKLREFYPSIVANPKDKNDAFPYFKAFCMAHKEEIIALLQTKLVQTNEVRRCGYLYPVFCYIYEKTNKPLALIEIGTSAGLQLLWDKYAYRYNNDEIYGSAHSGLTISAQIKGDKTPFLQRISPPVATRIGVDLNTIDLNNETERQWLKALIWPEHEERLQMFEQASNIVKEHPIKLVDGDGVGLLEKFVQDILADTTVCVFHTHVANQMPEEVKHDLLNKVKSIGNKRDIFHIYNNIQDLNLHLDYYVNGVAYEQTIAETDGHGRWFKWMLEDEV